jgi:hypothetical protein
VSTALFSADGFNGAGDRMVSLTACDAGYGVGTCATATRTVEITAAPAPVISCSPVDCTVTAGSTMDLHGDSSAAQFRYHQWRWTNATGATVITQRDTGGTGFVSDVVFSATGFDEHVEVQVVLTACSQGYGTGSCSLATAMVVVLSP